MIKARLKERLDQCFQQGVEQDFWSDKGTGSYSLERPKIAEHGDYATNMAMVVGGKEKKNPRAIADRLAELLLEHTDLIETVEVAGPGFVNIRIKDSIWQTALQIICEQDKSFGLTKVGSDKRVLVEFVSANPTGPLSVGHGRQAVLGDAIARLLDAVGYEVTREYYYNDAGRQMRVLGESTRSRYLELLGLPTEFPEDGYQGEYIRDIAKEIVEDVGDALKEEHDVTPFKERAEKAIFKDIDTTLQRLQIDFDNYYNEQSLYEEGLVDDVVSSLREKNLVYDEDGAVWFKTTEFGQEKDRVIIKSSGEATYRLPDIAYHREKFRRGYNWMVNVFGSDHIATVPDVLAGVRALGYDDSKVTVVMHQFVTLMREGKQVKMSTRKANFVTLDELIDEVGPEVARFFFLMRRADSQLDFDLDLATQQSQENPVYYLQYGHARIASIGRKAEAEGINRGPLEEVPGHLLAEPEELNMLKAMAAYPDVVQNAALNLEPHKVIFYLQDLAGLFHSYYNRHRVISDNSELTKARLWLVQCLQVVLRNGLNLIGVSAPESM